PFVTSVLLGLSGLDALDLNTETEPPDRQFRQTKQSIWRGKGDTVVGTNRPGEPKFLKYTFKNGKGIDGAGRRQPLTRQQVTGSIVTDRQWVAVAAVAQQELSLVVGTPQPTGLLGGTQCGRLGLVAFALSALHQPVSIQYGVDGTNSRWLNHGVLAD